MEAANLKPHHKDQQQYDKYFSLETQTGQQVSFTDEWNPNLYMNNGSKYNRNLTDLWPPPLIRNSMNVNHDSFNQQLNSEFLLENIKGEMSDSFPKLSEMINCPSSGSDAPFLPSKKHYPQSNNHGSGGNLWHNNFPIANHVTELQLSSGDNLYTNAAHHSLGLGTTAETASRYDFNDLFPSSNISTSQLCSTLLSNSLDLNLKALDLLTSTYDNGSCNQSLLEDYPAKHHIRERSDSPSTTTSKMSAFGSGSTTSTKRAAAGSLSETKESQPDGNKKHRSSMSRSPCPTLKVRKEKLGDRVAALQKLVAPFGKTDTASVLTEAIGYIQFLHDQVQTLSVPFMKPSQSKLYRTAQVDQINEEGKEEQKGDLRSRGLCLVHQSYASYFINSCGGGI